MCVCVCVCLYACATVRLRWKGIHHGDPASCVFPQLCPSKSVLVERQGPYVVTIDGSWFLTLPCALHTSKSFYQASDITHFSLVLQLRLVPWKHFTAAHAHAHNSPTHTHTHIHIHTHTHTHTHTHVYICIHTHTHTSTHTEREIERKLGGRVTRTQICSCKIINKYTHERSHKRIH